MRLNFAFCPDLTFTWYRNQSIDYHNPKDLVPSPLPRPFLLPLMRNLVYFIFKTSFWPTFPISDVRKGGFLLSHSLRVQSVMAGKAWQKEHEAAGHVVFTGRKQSQVNSVMGPSPWDGATHSWASSSPLS